MKEAEHRQQESLVEAARERECGKCEGKGSFWQKAAGGSLSGTRTLCPRCLGTGVQP
jgi:DnaJ-class molecular chaperone